MSYVIQHIVYIYIYIHIIYTNYHKPLPHIYIYIIYSITIYARYKIHTYTYTHIYIYIYDVYIDILQSITTTTDNAVTAVRSCCSAVSTNPLFADSEERHKKHPGKPWGFRRGFSTFLLVSFGKCSLGKTGKPLDHVMSCHVMSCHVMSCHYMLCKLYTTIFIFYYSAILWCHMITVGYSITICLQLQLTDRKNDNWITIGQAGNFGTCLKIFSLCS